MCDFQRDPRTLPPLAEDEYVVDSERVRRFIADGDSAVVVG